MAEQYGMEHLRVQLAAMKLQVDVFQDSVQHKHLVLIDDKKRQDL